MWVGRPVAGPPVDPGPTPAFTTALVSQGEQMYATMCSACHGEAGRGDGPAAATLAVRPANLAAGRIKAGSDPVQLYYRIATGIKGDTGQAMPAFGALPPDQIWSIVAFLEREVIP